METISNKLLEVLETKKAIKNSLEYIGYNMNDCDFRGYSEKIKNMGVDEWKPNPTWWDIKEILNIDEYYDVENPYRIIQLVIDEEDSITFSRFHNKKILTSDGFKYNVGSDVITHTWDKTQDKICYVNNKAVYNTRWFIYYYDTEIANDLLIAQAINNTALYFIVDALKIKTLTLGAIGNYKNKKYLQSFDMINGADSEVTSIECYNSYALEYFPLINTSKVTSFNNSFVNCHSLKSVGGIDTSNATSMIGMFNGCYSLAYIPHLNTHNVTNMGTMFIFCYSLKYIPPLDMNKVSVIDTMFRECKSLEMVEIDCESISSTGIANNGLFDGCLSLKCVRLYNTNNITSINNIFNGCKSLREFYMSDSSKVTDIANAFKDCNSLKIIDTKFNEGINDDNAFTNCYCLI